MKFRKNLMPVLIFSGLLAAPATVFAEASWYGSLRGGIEFASGMDAKFYDGASRWGIKGSGEISEGLTAVYRFEHKFSTSDAGQAGGRLAFVGLDGGFGKVTLGQIWSASYNHAGVIRDFPNWYTSGDTTGRIGNALSYAFSADAFSVQVDAIMDGGKDTGKAIDQLEFGMTVNLGDIGKIALAHTKMEDSMMSMGMQYVDNKGTADDKTDDVSYEVHKITVKVAKNSNFYDSATGNMKDNASTLFSAQTVKVMEKGSLAFPKGLEFTMDDSCSATATDPNACVMGTAYATLTGPTTSGTFSSVVKHFAPADVTTKMTKEYGSKSNHISAQFGIGGLTVALGHSQMKSNDPMKTMKQKTNFVGASGSIGDTGLNWGAYHREIKNPKNAAGKDKLWTVGLKKTLGGGASTYVEHHNDASNKGNTVVGLRVDF